MANERLLTDTEADLAYQFSPSRPHIPNNTGANTVITSQRKILNEGDRSLLQAQDAKTHTATAQEIFAELEKGCSHDDKDWTTINGMCEECYQSLKSRYLPN